MFEKQQGTTSFRKVEISFWEAEPASLSVSRIEGDSIPCVLRLSGGGQK
jgi:hypothetical protein